MNTPISPVAWETYAWPIPHGDGQIPILYEDEDEGDMGEANYHVLADEILHIGLIEFLKEHRPKCQPFSNMNLYYLDGPPHPRTGSAPYVSPDAMVVEPYKPLPEDTVSYKIGRDGPAPLLAIEVLSGRSGQQRDLTEKAVTYRQLRIAEYILVDITGRHLPEKLLLKRLEADGEYHDFRDADGGVTSELGFRLVMEVDGLRVVETATGHRYARPTEAETLAKAKRAAEEQTRQEYAAREKAERERDALQDRIRQLEEEIKRRDANSELL